MAWATCQKSFHTGSCTAIAWTSSNRAKLIGPLMFSARCHRYTGLSFNFGRATNTCARRSATLAVSRSNSKCKYEILGSTTPMRIIARSSGSLRRRGLTCFVMSCLRSVVTTKPPGTLASRGQLAACSQSNEKRQRRFMETRWSQWTTRPGTSASRSYRPFCSSTTRPQRRSALGILVWFL